MGMFSFFGSGEHKVFDYKPIYYKRDKNYVPGSYIKGSMRGGNYQKTRPVDRRIHTSVGIISLLLVAIILIFIAKFFTIL